MVPSLPSDFLQRLSEATCHARSSLPWRVPARYLRNLQLGPVESGSFCLPAVHAPSTNSTVFHFEECPAPLLSSHPTQGCPFQRSIPWAQRHVQGWTKRTRLSQIIVVGMWVKELGNLSAGRRLSAGVAELVAHSLGLSWPLHVAWKQSPGSEADAETTEPRHGGKSGNTTWAPRFTCA